ncbi:hypothetical protein Q0Z83_038990 [Actinoplanes sichuanensis]|uniref:hypothetical protein n=1 Tax=Actinoplanes sichuanensis TaxID=512349 RepID=UPI002954D1FD|nr:hypothetical protein [Actinoplanes sichuanensis]BEL05708.1 hypothetical protein Q0Z83_038990 [Actinoplanes sichuanensis]
MSTDLIPVTVREWTDILARIRFGTVTIAGKTYSAARIKLVAHRLATYADHDGTRIHPGIARLAVDLEIEYRTVRDTLTLLRRLGLLQLVRPAAGHRRADEYRLTLPTDLLDRDDLEVWTPTHHTQQAQAVRDTHRGTPRTRPTTTCTRGPQDPTPDPTPATAPGPQDPTPNPETQHRAESSRTTKPSRAGSSRTVTWGPQAPTTYQDHHTTPTDQNQDVTVTLTPTPRCAHGLTTARRPDGQPACALCRVDARRRRATTGIDQTPMGYTSTGMSISSA